MPRPKNVQPISFGKGTTDPNKVPSVPRSPAQGTGYPRPTELWWPCEKGHVVRKDWMPDREMGQHDVCEVQDCGAPLHGPYETRPLALADPVIKSARAQLTSRQKAS